MAKTADQGVFSEVQSSFVGCFLFSVWYWNKNSVLSTYICCFEGISREVSFQLIVLAVWVAREMQCVNVEYETVNVIVSLLFRGIKLLYRRDFHPKRCFEMDVTIWSRVLRKQSRENCTYFAHPNHSWSDESMMIYFYLYNRNHASTRIDVSLTD